MFTFASPKTFIFCVPKISNLTSKQIKVSNINFDYFPVYHAFAFETKIWSKLHVFWPVLDHFSRTNWATVFIFALFITRKRTKWSFNEQKPCWENVDDFSQKKSKFPKKCVRGQIVPQIIRFCYSPSVLCYLMETWIKLTEKLENFPYLLQF